MGHDPESGYEREQVVQIINSVISKVEEHDNYPRQVVFDELQSLRKIIDETRQDIGAVRATEINDEHIPTATDELDAVVQATADATGSIMDACEAIENKASAVGGENGDAIAGEVTKIYEACSFQDITGQRITKVVSSLRVIEEKVHKLLSAMGSDDAGSAGEAPKDEKTGDAALLNGPQMADQAISQEEIDKLLEDF